MTGSDTLDVPVIDDARFDIHGRAPVPSVVDFQIDTIAIIHMTKELKALTRRLKSKIFGPDCIRAWYEVFLTTFVLLSTLERIYRNQMKYLRANSGRVSGPGRSAKNAGIIFPGILIIK